MSDNPKVDTDESADDDDSVSRTTTSTPETTSRSATPHHKGKSTRKPRKSKKSKSANAPFKFSSYLQEDHLQPIFSTQFNHHILSDENTPNVFATAGSNRVSVYECSPDGGMTLVQCYADADKDEVFYTCCWSVDKESGHSILAVAGIRGVIRIINTITMITYKHLIGHGNAINELKFHPSEPALLLSAAQDHALRLWNIQSGVCIAIFGGVEGHRDQVLSADFNMDGNRIITCGMDHSLKLWRLDKSPISEAIKSSYKFNPDTSTKSFCTIQEHYPDFSTRDVHKNYVDCVKWLGNFVLSKSCENSIVCWKPGKLDDTVTTKSSEDTSISIIHRFEYKACEFWFIRFSLDLSHRFMALGNQYGKTFLWELSRTDPAKSRCSTLQNFQCVKTIRQTAFSRDGSILICVCDEGKIWKWDLCNQRQ